MNIEEDFLALLIDPAGPVFPIVADRVSWAELPQARQRPLISLWNITRDSQRVMEGPSGLVMPYVQIDCWADSAAGAKALADAVTAWLEPMQFVERGGTVFQGIFFESRNDGREPASGSPAARYVRTRLDVSMTCSAADPS